MKPFVLLKLPILTGLLGAAIVLAPPCKAQSEINPDHFDSPNTVPLEKVSPLLTPDTRRDNPKAVAAPAPTRKSNPPQTMQLAAARDRSTPEEQNVAAVADKRKTATRKPKNQ